MKGLLNGAPLPNWTKLVVLGVSLGILIGLNQASVARLHEGQEGTTEAIKELRSEIRDRLVPRTEHDLLRQMVGSYATRVEVLEVEIETLKSQLERQGRERR